MEDRALGVPTVQHKRSVILRMSGAKGKSDMITEIKKVRREDPDKIDMNRYVWRDVEVDELMREKISKWLCDYIDYTPGNHALTVRIGRRNYLLTCEYDRNCGIEGIQLRQKY